MAGWFRRWFKKMEVEEEGQGPAKAKIGGQPLLVGNVDNFPVEKRLARAKARLKICLEKKDVKEK